ncbi:uncharacterized protein LOC109837292 isoform X2 [Asparagus officinalis]|nr:uncharacterized protein LOC109837292 isoform X2 [Asparagus officinalis]
MLLSTARASVKCLNGGATSRQDSFLHPLKSSSCGSRMREHSLLCKPSVNILKDSELFSCKKSEAALRYEVLTDLQNQLTSILSKRKNAVNLQESPLRPLLKQNSENSSHQQSSDVGKKDEYTRTMPEAALDSVDAVSVEVHEQSMSVPTTDSSSGLKRKRNPTIVTPPWSYCETLFGTSKYEQSSTSQSGEAKIHNILKGESCVSSSLSSFSAKNIVTCLKGRERGISWPFASSHGVYAGKKQIWNSFLEGWRSLGYQFAGPAVRLKRKSYSSWVPTWSAYTSSAASAQPHGRVGVQKILDVRFHPEGLPQLVCSSNEAPNELLLYNLRSGRAIQLSGHNCQIQAVDFAVRGASIVSCGSKLLKVWDCITGSCLFTLGPSCDDQASVGHTEQINAMTVNRWQSCLVVTSGGRGDGKLLLWNALRGELAADLNANIRVKDQPHPSLNVMEFCSESLLACGSDSEYGGPAVVQLWDFDSPQSCLSFAANDSYITSLKANPSCNTLLTGSGDGTVGLFDIRTCGAINYLSIGSDYEVTSVSFSGCGTYFSVSSTSNSSLVWDTRIMPTNRHQIPLKKSSHVTDTHFFRPLHCLSHGKQMPTAEHAGQLPGHVDAGDQGVNDARWLHTEPVLVTASGDGSIAMWDVTLGMPCVRHLISHTRSVNTVAIAPNDEYLCSGGDDQKIVLYHNKHGLTHQKWRLSHPLPEKD